MTQLLPFFIILLTGLFFSEIFKRLHLPLVAALIIAGLTIGPSGLDWIKPNDALELIGNIGLIFLMFMAGLEIKLSGLGKLKSKIAKLSLINSLIPFLVGSGIGLVFGYGLLEAVLIGIIFMSSSVAVIVPVLESTGLMTSKIGQSIVGSAIIQDIVSLLFFSLILQLIRPETGIPLPLFYLIILSGLIITRQSIPYLRKFLASIRSAVRSDKNLFQEELRLIFTILIGVVVLFELIGLHDIIAGFFTGLILADSITSDILKEKIKSVGYSFFIPVFLVMVGIKTDLSILTTAKGAWLLILVIIIGSIGSKFISGYLAGSLVGFNKKENLLIGTSTIVQLFTTLAVIFAGRELGMIDEILTAALVLLSTVTTLVGPIIVFYLAQRVNLTQSDPHFKPVDKI
ncbi:MAG: cation:proton antiporter [Patescibacteria group bacterium]